MFETPQTLPELSEYELQNLVSYLAGEWAGGAPDPGYSWREFFKESDLGEVPRWFNEWLLAFELKVLLSIEDQHWQTSSLRLLTDEASNSAAIVSFSSVEPADRVGEPSYKIAEVSPDLLWPFVEDFLNREGMMEMNFRVYDAALVPHEKVRAFLEKRLSTPGSAHNIKAVVTQRMQGIYSDSVNGG